ncbi:YoaK family protein [Streptomyces sp. NPDC101118]|uniref:YoaK family protein n=1 Tax=Streptomyces sp. NPDC101118 TaxID=3366109 RepID=UPI003815B19D
MTGPDAAAGAGGRLFPGGHRFAGPAPLLLVLTFASGLVDAVSFLGLGQVFVANMTGNVVFLGLAVAGVGGLSAAGPAAALAAFLVGAVAAGRWPRAAAGGRLPALLVAVEAVLAGVALGCQVSGAGRYAVLVPLAVGMGLQNGMVRRLDVPDLTTTVVTRTLTGLAGARGRAAAVRRAVSVAVLFLGAATGGLLYAGPGVGWALGAAVVLLAGVVAAAVRDGAGRAPG